MSSSTPYLGGFRWRLEKKSIFSKPETRNGRNHKKAVAKSNSVTYWKTVFFTIVVACSYTYSTIYPHWRDYQNVFLSLASSLYLFQNIPHSSKSCHCVSLVRLSIAMSYSIQLYKTRKYYIKGMTKKSTYQLLNDTMKCSSFLKRRSGCNCACT